MISGTKRRNNATHSTHRAAITITADTTRRPERKILVGVTAELMAA